MPSEGFDGEAPEFPLPGASDREIELWTRIWTTPQACAWALQPWRQYTVGQWVRWSVKSEAEDASAAIVQATIRFADQIGLTPAGLKENGWSIATDEVAKKAAERDKRAEAQPDATPRRLRAAPDAGSG